MGVEGHHCNMVHATMSVGKRGAALSEHQERSMLLGLLEPVAAVSNLSNCVHTLLLFFLQASPLWTHSHGVPW